MRILYRRLAVTFTVAVVLLASVFTLLLYNRGKSDTENYLNQLLDSIEANMNSAEENYQQQIRLLEEDYLNRARAAVYIMSSENWIPSKESLDLLTQLLEAESISVMNNSRELLTGSITGEENQYYTADSLKKFLQDESTPEYEIILDEPDFNNRPSYFYVLIRSDSEYFSALRLDADLNRINLKSRREMTESILHQATTEYKTGIFAIGRNTGYILGMTENNEQRFEPEQLSTRETLLQFLDQLPENQLKLLKVNGKLQSLVLRKYEGIYLTALTSIDEILRQAGWIFLEGLMGIGLIGILTILVVRYQILHMEKQLTAVKCEAEIDALTGLYNRKGFEQRIKAFLTTENPEGIVVLFDLDNFKRVNDSEGHPKGDEVLQRFAECLNEEFRKSDFIGRLGGDEFAVLMPNSVSVDILEQKFEHFLIHAREAMSSCCQKYRISVSIGAVPADGSVKSYEFLYQCADTALYIAKFLGKDRYYINTDQIRCMRDVCIHCRKNCQRSLFLEKHVSKEERSENRR